MFDIGAAELLVIVIVAVLVIGPKDMPLALRTAGKWIGKIRRVSSHFRTGLDAMIREAELEDRKEDEGRQQRDDRGDAEGGKPFTPAEAACRNEIRQKPDQRDAGEEAAPAKPGLTFLSPREQEYLRLPDGADLP